MHITYIHHSCFSVELEDIVLLFDYYKGNLPTFDSKKHIFVFASHKHPDHFDLNIFNLAEKYPHISFILSKDIKMSENYMNRKNISEEVRPNIFYIGKNVTSSYPVIIDSTLHIKNGGIPENPVSIKVETLKSTDAGVAFIVSHNHKVIYHAGDLNWWSWQGESEEENHSMANSFQKEMDHIKDREFDAAFVPLDPRQEERFFWGFDYFMKNTNTKTVFPMHFWMDYSIISKLKAMDIAKDYADKVITITEEGQAFNI
jgi:L-ascorbate metabolism protein UlaG (beta-lactamase superfamily)